MAQNPIVDPRQGHDEAAKQELNDMLYARHVEIQSFKDLEVQRGTPIPALFNQFYKFIQNPSSVSVETYKRMIDTDDTIGSCVDFLTTCLAARIGRYQHPNQEITEFINRKLEQIEGGWFKSLKQILSASWAGFSVSEKVWENGTDGWYIKKLVSLPPGTVLFETERTGEITNDGILQYQRNYNPALFGAGTSYMFGFAGFTASPLGDASSARPDLFARLGDLPFPMRTANTYSYMSIRIPRRKVIHYSFDAQGNFDNPYGRSLLRRCYKDYVFKHTVYQMLATALDRKGTPLTVVYADNNTTLIDQNKFQPGVAANRQANVGIRADLAAREAFKNIHNDTVMILPGKKGQIFDTDFVEQHSNSTDFIQTIEMCNKAIMRAMLIPPLVFTGGDGSGSYSLGQEHARTWEKILDGTNAGLTQVLLQDVVLELLAYNFPVEMWKKDGLGSFSKRDLNQDEKQKEAALLEQGVNMGAIDMNDLNDLNKVREILGFESRDKIIEQPDMFGEEDAGENEGDDDGESDPSDSGDRPKGNDGKGQRDRANVSDKRASGSGRWQRLRGFLFNRNRG